MKKALPLLAALVLVACSKKEGAVAPPPVEDDPRPPTPAEWDRAVTRTDEATASAARTACTFARGSLPDETLGSELPVGKDMPIDTIVVIMQENRSFDHYFGRFNQYANRTDVAVAPENATNPERIGPTSAATFPYQRAIHHCFTDTAHGWNAVHKQLNGGAMDGFFETNHDPEGGAIGHGERAMWWYDERDIPAYYALAKAFGLGDHYFSSVPGPTWPNRDYLVAGTSFGRAKNALPNLDAYPFPVNDAVLFDELDKRHVDWKLYTTGGPPGAATVLGFTISTRYGRPVTGTFGDFLVDAAAGTLPSVVFLDGNALKTDDPAGDNEHPPQQLQVGQKMVTEAVKAVMTSPQWARSALFFTYDEHGGLYDHMPPPKACKPDDLDPVDDDDIPYEGTFDQLGVRVPFLVVSPYAKRGFVGHGVYDHTSILRFIQARFRLPALTRRDANALSPHEFFDFTQPPNLAVPALPDPVVDPGEMSYCEATFR